MHAGHPLPEVRQRALRSLAFKMQHGLAAGAAATGGAAAQAVLGYLALPAESDEELLVALELLAVLARAPDVAAHLLRLGADRLLIHLADAVPACTHPATALLGDLLVVGGAAAPAGGLQGIDGSSASTGMQWQPWEPQQLQQWSPAASAAALPSPWPAAAPPQLQALAAASLPAPELSLADALAGCGRRVRAVALPEEDAQQLVELALRLHPDSSEEAAQVAALATLTAGVLSDMPPAAVAGQPSVVDALLRVVDGARGRPRAASAALAALQAVAAGLAAAEEAGEGDAAGLPLAHIAYQGLLRCAASLSHSTLAGEALSAASALVPLLAPSEGSAAPSGAAMAPLMSALADALRLGLVRACTAAGVAPPEDLAASFHALALDCATAGTLRLLASLLERMPHLATPQVGQGLTGCSLTQHACRGVSHAHTHCR